MKQFFVSAVLVAVSLSSVAVSHAVTSNLVYKTDVVLLSVTQGGTLMNPKIMGTTLTTKHIINLARGRVHTATVPAHEVLAVAVNGVSGAWNFRLIVFDKTTSSNLVTVATVPTTDQATAGAAHTVVTSFIEVPVAGSSTYNFSDGSLVLSGKTDVKFPTTDMRTTIFNLSGSVVGAIDTTENGVAVTRQIAKGKVIIGGRTIGILVEP